MPAWTYAQLKAAYVAIGSPVLASAVVTLNGQTTALSSAAFAWHAVKALMRQSSTGDWAKIVSRSRMVAANPPVTAVDFAILAAINLLALDGGDMVDPSSGTDWTTLQNGLAALQTAGDVSSATASAVTALTSPTVPTWQPHVRAKDISIAIAPMPWSYVVTSVVPDPGNGNIVATATFTNSATGTTLTRQTWGDNLSDVSIASWASDIIKSLLVRDHTITTITTGATVNPVM